MPESQFAKTPADPLSAGVISGELHRRLDGGASQDSSACPLAERPHSVKMTQKGLWAHAVYTVVQLFALPLLDQGTLNATRVGPALGVALAYFLFAAHFQFGQRKARVPYVLFSGLMMMIGFNVLAHSALLAQLVVGLSIIIAGGLLYGVLTASMSTWLTECAERQRLPTQPAAEADAQTLQSFELAGHRAFKAARRHLLMGACWLGTAALGLKLAAASTPAALLVGQVTLLPMAAAGGLTFLTGLWRLVQVRRRLVRFNDDQLDCGCGG